MAIAINENAMKVLKARYFTKDEHGNTIEDAHGMFTRVAGAIAKADLLYDETADIKSTEQEFYDLMTSLRFMPNSPTLMNAGKALGQLSACFVLPIPDSMEQIFEAVKQAALIHKSGGGTGFSFSRLRHNGARVNTTGGIASGPVSFMKVFNAATEAVKQGGTRRGANMGILRIDHPDIMEFIRCKSDNESITNFNISIGITEAFMQSVQDGSDYDLIDPTTKESVGKLNARKIFEEIVDAAHKNGEPGIIFLDRLNRDNIVPSKGEIESTNPCGEQPLLPFESCNLGSINLVKMLKESENGYELDYNLLKNTVHSAVHFLDNVIDVNNYPLIEIDKTTKDTRKIGLGVMGFADMLLYLGIPYNSDEALECAESIMAFINIEGQNASKKIARYRGAFPLFYESIFAKSTPVRNGTVTTIAPTGTISMIASCSSGIEPIFAYVYIRNIMDGTEMIEVNPVLKSVLTQRGLYSDELMKKIAKEGSLAHIDEIPEDIKKVFVCSHDISPNSHIKMQAAFQHHTNNAVSKTINMSNSAGKKQVAECYMLAFKLGCKGVTIYRDGSRAEQVLNIGSVNKKEAQQPNEQNETQAQEMLATKQQEIAIGQDIAPRKRPAVTMGFTERMQIGCGNLYITVNYDKKGICEVFTSTGKAGGCPSQSEATARLVSIALRSGISVDDVYHQLKGIRCPSTVRRGGMPCTSCPDAIAKVLKKVNNFISDEENANVNIPEAEKVLPSRSHINMKVQAHANEPAAKDNTSYSESEKAKPAHQNANLNEQIDNTPNFASSQNSDALNMAQNAKNAQVNVLKPQEDAVLSEHQSIDTVIDDLLNQQNLKNESAPHFEQEVNGENNSNSELTREQKHNSVIENIKQAIFTSKNDIEKAFNISQEEFLNEAPQANIKEVQSEIFAENFENTTSQAAYDDFATSELQNQTKDFGTVSTPPEQLNLPHESSYKDFIANEDDFLNLSNELEEQRLIAVPVLSNSELDDSFCPECDGVLEHEGGCVICRNCGYSKCG